ncbi:hypothetical protein D9611_005953 [Ephemerocybe angulata]|uniref:Uncharacterized protein n=1 Tax=Ephemerocybe angulata TaxID=980116 RepID=A0A8H5CFW3_9AGAR|nr:hypothetical protein D9611_005953 [Tulosesus angulatus]
MTLLLPPTLLQKPRDGRRWTELPIHPTSKGELSESVCSLIRRIIAGLGEPTGDGVARDVVDSHAANLKHPKYKDLCPGISIRATGPSFGRSEAINEYIDGVGYANLASPIDVNLEQPSNEKDQVAQAAFYSKQIYTEQPNRNFIRSLFVTEKNLRLIQTVAGSMSHRSSTFTETPARSFGSSLV